MLMGESRKNPRRWSVHNIMMYMYVLLALMKPVRWDIPPGNISPFVNNTQREDCMDQIKENWMQFQVSAQPLR